MAENKTKKSYSEIMTTFCIPADPTDPHQIIIITAARMNFMARSDQQLGGSSKFVIASTRGLSQL